MLGFPEIKKVEVSTASKQSTAQEGTFGNHRTWSLQEISAKNRSLKGETCMKTLWWEEGAHHIICWYEAWKAMRRFE